MERAHVEGYRMLVEPMRFNGNFHLHYFPTLARRLHDIHPDIVHIDEEPYNVATWHALWLARRTVRRRCFSAGRISGGIIPCRFRLGERWVLRHVDYAIMGTDSAAEVWRAKGYRGPLTVIPQFGVDPAICSARRRNARRARAS